MAEILNRQPSFRQRKAAKIRLENPQLDDKEVVALSGFASGTQHTPSKVTQSKGYKKALEEYGLTEKLIKTALVSDIKSKPRNRVSELRLGSEILGLTEDNEKQKGSTFNTIVINESQGGRLAKRYLSRLERMSESSGRFPNSDESKL